MRIASLWLAAGLVPAFGLGCLAAEFDGSKPFLCATADVASCVPAQNCARESAGSVDAPTFFTVDVGKKLVSEAGGNGSARTSNIDRADRQGGLLLLQGNEGAQSWIATVGVDSGKFSYAVVGDRVAVVAFGACLIR